jgi:hypothetical protein
MEMTASPIDDSNSGWRSLTTTMEWMAAAIGVAASVLLLGSVIYRCRYGFDFTDEGYYLNWISSPWNFDASVTQFGFAYHPLYLLVGGDIALLRQANVLITWALSCALCVIWVRSLCLNWTALRLPQRAGFIAAAIALASPALALFDLWLPTPNYNSLALQSLITATIGALLANRKWSRSSIAGWILIGIGGGVAFLAKPPTAAMLGCLIALYVAAAGKFSLRGLSVSMATAVLLMAITGLAIDGSLPGFVGRFVKGLDLGSQLAPGARSSRLFRWDGFGLSRGQRTVFVIALFSSCGLATLAFLRGDRARLCAALAAALLSALSIVAVAGFLPSRISAGLFQPTHFWSILLAIQLTTVAFAASTYRQLSRSSLALIVFLLMLPYAYALGTGNNPWTMASRAALFWVLAGFVVCVENATVDGTWRRLLPMTAVTLLMTATIVTAAMEYPYRQTQPLRLQSDAVAINRLGSRLLLTTEAATYVRDLGNLAKQNGFRTGDLLLDLTGASPGSLYVIGARPLGAAWLLGGYPGSRDFLTTALRQESCGSIGSSWILTEPGSGDALSPGLLVQYGIDVSQDYLDVGSIDSKRSFAPTTFEQRLLKPTRNAEVARQSCEEARRADSSRPQ